MLVLVKNMYIQTMINIYLIWDGAIIHKYQQIVHIFWLEYQKFLIIKKFKKLFYFHLTNNIKIIK
jgi:hypothetical protein